MIVNGYDRITEIVGAFVDWSKIPAHYLEEKAQTGTLVHRLIELYLQGNEVHVMPEEAMGYYASFKDFHEAFSHTWDIESIELEKRLYCDKHRITGQLDMIVKGHGKTYIFDWKTSSSVQPTHHLQAAAYRYLAIENGYTNVEPVTIVRLKPDGKKPTLTKKVDSLGDLEMFFKILDVYRFYKKGD